MYTIEGSNFNQTKYIFLLTGNLIALRGNRFAVRGNYNP